MNAFFTLVRPASTAKRCNPVRDATLCVSVALLGTFTVPARAVDGCTLLMCLAAPNWHAVPRCGPEIQRALHGLEQGRPLPACATSGPTNGASHQWSSAPTFCPSQYTHVVDGQSGPIYDCDYLGAVAVHIGGVLWTRTWWTYSGDTVTEFTPAAKTQLGTWDTQFDDDYAAKLAAQPAPTQSPCSSC